MLLGDRDNYYSSLDDLYELCEVAFCIAIGPKFRKTSKWIRAVKLSDYRKHNPAAFQGSTSDSDFEPPPRKQSKILKSIKERDLIEERLQKLEQELSISNENSELKMKVAEMREKDKKLKEAEARYDSVKQCFQCLVCKETAIFPAVVSTCCNIVLGCKSHVQEWLETTSQCPHCREPMETANCTVIPFICQLRKALSPSPAATPPSSPILVG